MTPYVLLCKRTGNLLIGYRMCFLDTLEDLLGQKVPAVYRIEITTHDGWIVKGPDFFGTGIFMNCRWVKENFEELGEL